MTNELMEKYKNLIYKMMYSERFRSYPYREDLFQAGCVGLTIAYDHFDASYGVEFTTYAYYSIMGEMSKLVREDKPIRINRNIRKLQMRINTVSSLLTQELMREPTLDELAHYLEIPKEALEEAMLAQVTVQSLDMPFSQGEKEMSPYDVIEAPGITMDNLIQMKESLQKLNPEEKKLVSLYNFEDRTQGEIAKIMDMNQVQVSRKLQKVKQKLTA